MARPKKDGLDYFPVDVDFDKKVKSIEMLHENDGITWVIKFWQEAYKTMTGLVDFRGLFGELFTKNCRITTEKHMKILETAISVEFCYEHEEGIYTSEGIQKRISAVSNDRKSAIERQNADKKKKSKRKKRESKVKDCPDYSPNNSGTIQPEIPDHLKVVWPMYVDMRKKTKKAMTENAEKLALSHLSKLSQDPLIQIKIVEQSVMYSYQGLFPLKDTNYGKAQHEFERNASSKYDDM